MSVVRDKVSVVIVTHNSEKVLPACLTSLAKALDGIPHELILSDNDSFDKSAEICRRHFPSARIMSHGRNTGFADACNRGAAVADGEFLLFVNPDLVVDTGAVKILCATIRSHEKAGLTVGRLRFENGQFQPSCRQFPTIGNLLFSRGSIMTSLASGKTISGAPTYTLGDAEDTAVVPAVAGTFVMVLSDVFRAVNGFDSRFFMYMEDTDLSLRVSQAGYDNLFVPAAGAVHLWGTGSTIGRLRRKIYHHRSLWMYFLKHRANAFSLVLLPLLLAIHCVLVMIIPDRERGRL